jgi:sugar phosphate isomerase/epimerase
MRSDLLNFLFSDAVVKTSSAELGEAVVKLFETAADKSETVKSADEATLAKTLKKLGVTLPLAKNPFGYELHTSDAAEYKKALAILKSPEGVYTLGDIGYVVTAGGEQTMSNEPEDYKINLYSYETPEPSDKEQPDSDLEKIAKEAAKEAAKDALAYPGVKDNLKWESYTSDEIVERLLETTTASSLAPLDGPAEIIGAKPPHSGRNKLSRIQRIRALQRKRRRLH